MIKKTTPTLLLFILFIAFVLFLSNLSLIGQDKASMFNGLPDNIDKIVSVSCVPCHTSKGGLMSRSKLNFEDWTHYSPEKQKARAEKMYTLLNKGDMPPKSARREHPENIPTKDQIDAIKIWSETFKTDSK